MRERKVMQTSTKGDLNVNFIFNYLECELFFPDLTMSFLFHYAEGKIVILLHYRKNEKKLSWCGNNNILSWW